MSLANQVVANAATAKLTPTKVDTTKSVGRTDRDLLIKATVTKTAEQKIEDNRRKGVSGLHQTSTFTATIRPIQHILDQLLTHQLKDESAPVSDSPDNTPDGNDNGQAARSNLNLVEQVGASLIRQCRFDRELLGKMELIDCATGPQSGGNIFDLASGNVIFAPCDDVNVLFGLGEMKIAAGSMVCIMKPNSNVVAIYDLDDRSDKRVRIKTASETIVLWPGRQVVLTDQPGKFDTINPGRRISYRGLRQRVIKETVTVYSAEFSISAAVLTIKPLSEMLFSDQKADLKSIGQILKDKVILDDVISNNDPFKFSVEEPLPVSTTSQANTLLTRLDGTIPYCAVDHPWLLQVRLEASVEGGRPCHQSLARSKCRRAVDKRAQHFDTDSVTKS